MLGVNSDELMGSKAAKSRSSKPGPASRWQQLMLRLAELPRSQQQVVAQMLEGFLQQTGKTGG